MGYLSDDSLKNRKLEELAKRGINVTKGLEGRFNTTSKNIFVKLEEEKPDFLRLSVDYKASMIIYTAELTKRAYLDKSIYDKLVDDLFALREEGVLASIKPQLYYYQGGKGVVFADPQWKNTITDEDVVRCAFKAVFGSGLPEYCVGFATCNFITEELYTSLKRAEEICLLRLMEVFTERGYSYDLVSETLNAWHSTLNQDVNLIDDVSLRDAMEEFYCQVRGRDTEKKEGPNFHFTKKE